MQYFDLIVRGCILVRVRIYKNKKGFTLAELLVVVAIIAILVTVSIPIFTGKLDEARKNTDLANERAAKAAISDYMQSDQESGYYKFYDADSGTMIDPNTESTSGIKGYNQTEKQGSGINNHAITVTITPSSGGGKANVELYWHLLK